jgi:hypothetical protein
VEPVRSAAGRRKARYVRKNEQAAAFFLVLALALFAYRPLVWHSKISNLTSNSSDNISCAVIKLGSCINPPTPFKSSQVKSLITKNSFCIVQRATAQSKTGFFRDFGVAEALPGFQAGWSDCIFFFSLFLFILFAHLGFPCKFLYS